MTAPEKRRIPISTETTERKRPKFKGLKLYADEHICFWWPNDWHRFEWPDHEQAVVLGPTPQDQSTLFAVEVTDIGMSVKESDLDDLEEGFLDGIKQLPGSEIESHDRWNTEDDLGVEARYTFQDGDVVRKRWVRLHYRGSTQVSVTSQGSTVEEFHYWLPMFYEAAMTLRTHEYSGDQTEILKHVYGVL